MQDGVVSLALPAINLVDRSGAHVESDSSTAPSALNTSLIGSVSAGGTFIAGPENALVGSTIQSILGETRSPYNPLIICGLPSSGKSHVASGLAARWQREHPGDLVLALSGADFARQFAAAVQDDAVDVLRKRFLSADLFVIEDLTQLISKRAAQQELASLLDGWLAGETQVVITSKVSPGEIAAFPPRLISRLTGGLVLPLAMPESLARIAILERTATDRSMQVDPAALKLLGEQLHGTVSELTAALMDLQLAIRVDNSSQALITVDQVRKFLAKRTQHAPNLRGIATLTAKYFGLKVSDLTSPSRRRAVVAARGVAMYLARELTGKSLEQVGAHFGRRDHTTVLHSYRSTEKRLRADPETRRAITDLRTMLTVT